MIKLIKILFVFPLFILLPHCLYSQIHLGIGYTGARLVSNTSIAGGFSFFAGKNIVDMRNSSFSVSTNVKIGMEDKAGTGVIIPLIIAALYYGGDDGNTFNNATTNDAGVNGGTIHLFVDLPLLLHYNFGLGSDEGCKRNWGFYLGGGVSYTTTGFTNISGFSRATDFFGYVMDGGIRFAKNVDINISNTISARKPIGPLNHPIFSEITLALRLEHRKKKSRRQ
ncbi:hypothetical protein F0919_07460 [Taibaiella lutea]|uniref:Outer membrane protein beta-barrel domain-containing protein n=1 Tax=Taibaiella lutea TaxID=2608001 RepID=A0A5M6CHI6_9BACT|nr:hypothetical protein [Taibaiella lutea]KAA5534453.1 hypothetical protein F0919_07460 [Taibaiella lutea]